MRITHAQRSSWMVRLSIKVNQRLEALAAAQGRTTTDSFRRALSLYMLAKKQEKAGARLQFANGDQVEVLVSIGWMTSVLNTT